VEGVPGPQGTGLADVFTFDPLSCRFRQGKGDEPPLVLEQQQGMGGWKPLPPQTVFWADVDGDRDNPYGVPLFSAAINEALSDLRLQRVLQDLLWFTAWPRVSVGLPIQELTTYATENYASLGLLPPGSPPQKLDKPDRQMTPTEWAMAQFAAFKTLIESIKPHETLIGMKGGQAEVLQTGGLDGSEGILKILRQRLIQSADELPGNVGVTDGGTQAYGTVQMDLKVKKLEALRHTINTLLWRIAALHLRLLGLPFTVKVEVKPIISKDEYREAQTEVLRTQSKITWVDAGMLTPEEASVMLTGSGVADQEKCDAYFERRAAGEGSEAAQSTQDAAAEDAQDGDPEG
jgi:hypothetical protein